MQQPSFRVIVPAFTFLVSLISGTLRAQQRDSLLEQGFRNPPESARPRTWWHWTNSNITRDGITKDLEWMKRVGLGGIQLSDVAFGSGQTVEKKLVFGSPEWLEAVRYSAEEAKRLGLEMTMFSSAGWSLTGGPWVKPEEAMKKLVWSETVVEGGTVYHNKLLQPPAVEGPILNVARSANAVTPGFYKDFAVVAFRTPEDEGLTGGQQPAATTGSGTIHAATLSDGNLSLPVSVRPSGKAQPAWLLLEYPQPVRARAIQLAAPKGIPYGRIMASADGIRYTMLAALPGKQGYRPMGIRTYAFPETTARFFRIEFTGAAPRPADVISQVTTLPDSAYLLSECKIITGARVHRWEDKAGFNFMFEYGSTATPEVAPGSAIATSGIVDLTPNMQADGTLQWKVPAGKWTIMRFGYSLTGARNRPAVPSGLGYECDKLSRKHTESYLRGYTAPFMKALGALYGETLGYIMLDSWEAGIQNWTDSMPAEFRKRRGYDLTPFLPVLAGRVVQSAAVSDRLLWDFRRTLVDMFAENHYGVITEFLHKQGLKTYGEAGGVSLESIEDALLDKKYVDIPMGEFWVKDLHPSSMYYEDVRGAASAAHVYGKPLVAAESFTGGNYESPYTLKKVSDYWFTQGINRLVFHTSAHQPLDTKPGNSMVGTHLHRNITWAELARPLITYLSRNAYMLQQGRYVADIAYLLDEGAPSTMPFWGAGLQPVTPEGYAFDYINADALISRMTVDAKGGLVLPDSMRYTVLVLPLTDRMTLPLLQKLKALVVAGATIVGPRPVQAPGLSGYPGADQEIAALAGEIWGDLDGVSRTMRRYEKGRVYWGMPLSYVMAELNVAPDVSFDRPVKSHLSWTHRKDGDHDLYFIVNRTDSMIQVNADFRVNGRAPERWHADNGTIEPAAYTMKGDHTAVPLSLDKEEAVFIVFRRRTPVAAQVRASSVFTPLMTLPGPWEIRFPAQSGAPASVPMKALASWTENPDEGVKYFSGTATYHSTFQFPKKMMKAGQKLYLDLNNAGDIAEVYLNGHTLDTLWKAPFRTDMTRAVKAGSNQLEIRVTNEWTNRLLGDQQAAPGKKVLSAYIPPFGGRYELTPSGLRGLVTIVAETKGPGGK